MNRNWKPRTGVPEPAYMAIPAEVEAYANDNTIEAFYTDDNNTKEFMGIINDETTSMEMKTDKMEVLGAEKVAIPSLEEQISLLRTSKL